MKPITFDLSPLHEEIDSRTAREFEARFGQAPKPVNARRSAVLDIVGLFLWLIVCVATVVITVIVPNDVHTLDEPLERSVFGLALVIPVSIVFFLIYVPIMSVAVRGTPTRFARYRLARFAEANGMSYSSRRVANDTTLAFDVVRGEHPLPIEIGNLHISPHENVEATVKDFAYGYVAVRLPHAMPHIVLDATSNDLAISLGVSIEQNQRQRLEGDFDRHFALYCAEGYERDALYIFTPDVMASFVDGAAALDVEFRDDTLFFYSADQLSTPDENRWRLIEGALVAVLPQLQSWQRWRDTVALDEPTIRPLEPAAAEPTSAPQSEPEEPTDSPTLLISLRTAELSTRSIKRKTPLWARLVMIGVLAYAAVMVGLAIALD